MNSIHHRLNQMQPNLSVPDGRSIEEAKKVKEAQPRDELQVHFSEQGTLVHDVTLKTDSRTFTRGLPVFAGIYLEIFSTFLEDVGHIV